LLIENIPAHDVLVSAIAAIIEYGGSINLANAKIAVETLNYKWDKTMMKKIVKACSAYVTLSKEK
jgi:hypothetical protein